MHADPHTANYSSKKHYMQHAQNMGTATCHLPAAADFQIEHVTCLALQDLQQLLL